MVQLKVHLEKIITGLFKTLICSERALINLLLQINMSGIKFSLQGTLSRFIRKLIGLSLRLFCQ